MKKLGAVLLIVLLLFFGYRTFLAPKADESSGTTNEVLKNDVEVEKEELILHLELTEQVEALWKQFKNAETPEEKNRIAFECGDLLCKEIITNTEDNTNLINEL